MKSVGLTRIIPLGYTVWIGPPYNGGPRYMNTSDSVMILPLHHNISVHLLRADIHSMIREQHPPQPER